MVESDDDDDNDVSDSNDDDDDAGKVEGSGSSAKPQSKPKVKGGKRKKATTPAWKTSTKLEAIVAHIRTMVKGNSKDKCIIFSQWTSMLDMVGRILDDNGVVSVRLDGSLSQQQRVAALDKFKSDDSVNVLVMSLRAGGVGLNLSAASHVILIDPWWNPAVEEQAIDRVHRIGQKKEVTVLRFIMKGSVEERILQLQTKKKHLASAAMSKATDQRRQERVDDLRLLFGFSAKSRK